jgi:phospholipid/cholesterol/gamma-HCH transport system ATP-binding protein
LIDVHKQFGEQKVLKGVNLAIHEGTTTVITGASGTGKSVILKHMMGLIKPTRGRVMVFNREINRLRKKELRKIRMDFGVLFQNVALFDSMTVYDNVALPLRERTGATEEEIRRNVEDKLSVMDLKDVNDKYPAQLSGGMLKRVGLARGLVLNPKVIFFDEPTTGLDDDFPRIFKLSDYIALLKDGQIVSNVTPEEFQLSSHPAIKSFVETTMGPIYISEEEESNYNEKI